MKTLTQAVFFTAVLMAILISFAAGAWTMPCDETCFTTFGCTYLSPGFAVLNYYHRCDADHMDCGSYDPTLDDCQKWCQWDLYWCCSINDCIDCRSITAYAEGCITQ